jgi:hypothetical protein
MMRLLLLIMVVVSSNALSSETYLSHEILDVYDNINGQIVEQWPDRTLFTAKVDNVGWLTVTGTFPEGVWQPVSEPIYVLHLDTMEVRHPYTEDAGNTVIYKALVSTGSNAKAYKLEQSVKAYIHEPSLVDEQVNITYPDSYETWPKGYVFTARYENRFYVKATGYFPEQGGWQPLSSPRWIFKPVEVQDRTQPRPFTREENTTRVAVIDKNNFELVLYEIAGEDVDKIISTPVALGYDRCLPASKGGKCYYTPEGVFEIEFKLFDPDGISWCVPPKMEAEFADKLANGERCWRGIMGRHALHFGNSLFLHGTSNPSSIGSRTTHGCVRLRNNDIELIYKLMKEGDKVVVTESPENIDFSALHNRKLEKGAKAGL